MNNKCPTKLTDDDIGLAVEEDSEELKEQETDESAEPSTAIALRSPLVTLHEPDAQLVAHQVASSLSVSRRMDYEQERELMECSIALYAAIEPKDAVESLLSRLSIAATNASMDCFSRAAMSGCWPEARDLNLRYGIKGALAVAELVKALDQHRGRNPQSVNVGQVTVQSGGQAIVGNVGPRERREEAAEPVPMLISTRPDDETQE